MDSASQRIYDDIRLRIMKGEYDANSFFVENGIAEEYGVSRGTAREAMLLLCEKKYLVKHPRKGYFLYVFSEKELKDYRYIRYNLEMSGIRMVFLNCSDEEIRSLKNVIGGDGINYLPETMDNYRFHMALARLSGNTVLCEMLSDLLDATSRIAVSKPGSMFHISHQHIVEAILARDLDAVSRLLALDIGLSEQETFRNF